MEITNQESPKNEIASSMLDEVVDPNQQSQEKQQVLNQEDTSKLEMGPISFISKPATHKGSNISNDGNEVSHYFSSIHSGELASFVNIRDMESKYPNPEDDKNKSKRTPDSIDNLYANLGINKESQASTVPPSKSTPQQIVNKTGEEMQSSADKITGIAKQVGGGIADAVQNTWNNLLDFTEAATEKLQPYGLDIDKETIQGLQTHFADSFISPPQNMPEGLAREYGLYLLPMLGWSKALRAGEAVSGIGKFGLSQAAFGLSTLTSTDHRRGNLSDLIEADPTLRGPVLKFFASDPSDTRAEAIFKKELEGLALGGMTELLFQGVRLTANLFKTKKMATSGGRTPPPPNEQMMEAKASQEPSINPEFPVSQIDQQALKTQELPPDAQGAVPPPAPESPVKTTPPTPKDSSVVKEEPFFIEKPPGGISAAQIRKMGTIPAELSNVPEDISGFVKRTGINLNKAEISLEIKDLIRQYEATFPSQSSAARRGVVTEEAQKLATTKALEQDLGFTLKGLLTKNVGDAYTATEIESLRVITYSMADDLVKKSQIMLNGGPMEKIAFDDAMQTFRLFMGKLEGAGAEAGRSLRSFNTILGVADQKIRADMVKNALDMAGGSGSLDDMARKIMAIGNLKELSTAVRWGKFDTFKAGLFNTWIQSLFGIKSVGKELVSDFYNTYAARPIELYTKATIGKIRNILPGEHEPAVSYSQVNGHVESLFTGIKTGFKAMAEAFKSGKPVMDDIRLYKDQMGVIEKSREGGDRTLMDLFHTLGSVTVGLPVRSIMAISEYFKTVNFHSSLHMSAIEAAERSGKVGPEFNKLVRELRSTPTEDMIAKATKEMRENSWTKIPEGRILGSAYEFMQNHPLSRGIVPLYKTKLNLIQNQIERSPVAFLYPSVIADLRAGGQKSDEALAKIAYGSTIIGLTYAYATSGVIVGKYPADESARKAMELAKIPEYSVRINGKYYKYDQLDPFGGMLAMGADLAHDIPKWFNDEVTSRDIMASTAALFAKYYLPKDMISSFSDFLKAVDEPEHNKQGEKFVEKFIGGLGVGTLREFAHLTDPVKRSRIPDKDTPYGDFGKIINSFKSSIPGFSEELPEFRDRFGKPQYSSPGYGKDSLSPIYVSDPGQISPARKEIMRLGMASEYNKVKAQKGFEHLSLSDLPRYIKTNNEIIELNNIEYDRYQQLAGGFGLERKGGFADDKGNLFAQDGRSLEDAISYQVKHDFPILGPQGKNDLRRIIAINNIIREYKDLATDQFLRERDDLGFTGYGKIKEKSKETRENLKRKELDISIQ